MTDNVLMLVVSEAKTAAIDSGSENLKGIVEAAMSKARNHWMCTDENKQLHGAISGVFLALGEMGREEDKAQLLAEYKALIALNSGNMTELIRWAGKVDEPLGLISMWKKEDD